MRLITLPRPSPSPRPMRFLRVLPLLLSLPNKELHYPRRSRQKHDRDCNPSDDQILGPAVRVRADIIPVFVDNMYTLAHDVCDERGGHE